MNTKKTPNIIRKPPTPGAVTFILVVEYDEVDAELLEHIGEIIEKAREQGKPVEATLQGFPSILSLKV